MNKTEQNIHLIDRYLQNKLTAEELAMFNQMLKDDVEFEKLFYEMDQLIAGIRFSSRTSTVEEKLARLEQSLPTLDPATGFVKRTSNFFNSITDAVNQFLEDISLKIALTVNQVKLALSGVAATILITLTMLINFQHTQSPEVLFLSYCKPPMYENFGATRGAGDQVQNPIVRKFNGAMSEYNEKNYVAAITIINKLPEDQLTAEMKLYKAYVNIKLENYGMAKQNLHEVISNADPTWANLARWYLGLCLVRENNYAAAKPMLTSVRDFGSDYAREAGQLLEKIDKE
jgi:hypothetical protein